ncbi:MAG TPA: hypothetical protein VGH90_07150, partial [Chthoniobacteraceae bacterium]
MQVLLLVLLTLLCVTRTDADDAITPERADALFAWLDQLPLPGLHGTDLVRVRTGSHWQNAQKKWEPDCYLAFLVEDSPKSFRVLMPDGEYASFGKRGANPGELGFTGFRKVSLLDEARQYLAQYQTQDHTKEVRYRWFGYALREFSTPDVELPPENLLLAYWCAKASDEQLALSLLNARPAPQRHGPGAPPNRDSLEIALQKDLAAILRSNAFRSFAEKKRLRPDLLASFQTIVALCPKADLSKEQDAIRILETMIREDDTRPALTAEQLDALPPAARAEELVFRLRDERRPNRINDRDPIVLELWPDNGALVALVNLEWDAAPALIKALDDDSFTREGTWRTRGENVFRVRDLALEILKTLSGCSFSSPAKSNGSPRSEFDVARDWWKGVSEKGEKEYLMEYITADDSQFEQNVDQLLKKYAHESIPFIVDRARAETALERRVILSRALWKRDDPRCADFFARQVLEGPDIGDRVAAAHGLRTLHDARAVSAMCAEWPKIVATNGKSNWPLIDEGDPTLENPWSVANFLATSNAPEASLCLGGNAASIPAEWRARIISRLAKFLGGKCDDADPPAEGAKKAVEDVFLSFLSDAAEYPPSDEADLIGAGRICDLAAVELHEVWPRKYEFDRWQSPAARTRQCLTIANTRSRELGEPLLPLPPESPKKPLQAKARPIVSEVSIDPPLAQTAIG